MISCNLELIFDYVGEFPGLSKLFKVVVEANDPFGEGMKTLQRLLNDVISRVFCYTNTL